MEISKKKTSARQRRYDVTGWLFCLPAVVFGLIFLITPIALSFLFSFTDYHMLRGLNAFVGFKHYAELLKDAVFGKAILNTIKFVIFVVPLQCGLALALALLVNRTAKGFGVFKLAYFAPVITSMTVVALLFMNFYDTTGLFNLLLGAVGIDAQGFLHDPNQAMYSIIFMSVWQGANGWQKFRNVTLPGILSVGSFVLLITVIGAFKLFTQPYIMTQGGPDNSTMTIVLYIYERGMTDKLIGYGSAIAMLFTFAFIAASAIGKGGGRLVSFYRKKRDAYIEEMI